MADCYIAFALKNRRLWNVLFQHMPTEEVGDPHGANSILRDMRNEFVSAGGALHTGGNPHGAERLAASVWFCVHAMSAIAVSEKDMGLDPGDAAEYIGVITEAVIAHADRH